MLATRAADAQVPVAYVNLVGGQDELVFDGASMIFDDGGHLVARGGASSREDLLLVDLEVRAGFRRRLLDPRGRTSGPALVEVPVSDAVIGAPLEAFRVEPLLTPVHEVYEALVLGTRDYVTKNGFEHVLIGLSGGIDSSLVATIAADALVRQGHGRADAVALFERGQHHRLRSAGPQPRDQLDNDGRDRGGAPGVHRDAGRGVFGASRRDSPRRTCRRVSAGRSS